MNSLKFYINQYNYNVKLGNNYFIVPLSREVMSFSQTLSRKGILSYDFLSLSPNDIENKFFERYINVSLFRKVENMRSEKFLLFKLNNLGNISRVDRKCIQEYDTRPAYEEGTPNIPFTRIVFLFNNRSLPLTLNERVKLKNKNFIYIFKYNKNYLTLDESLHFNKNLVLIARIEFFDNLVF